MLWMKRMMPSWLPSKEKKEKVTLALIVKGVALILPKCLRMMTMRGLWLDEVKDADTAKDMKHGYRLSLQQFIVFIFLKKGKNKEESKDAMYCVLHKDLVVQVDSCKHAKARHMNNGLWILHGMHGIIVHKRLSCSWLPLSEWKCIRLC
jgi:hypothetical protein